MFGILGAANHLLLRQSEPFFLSFVPKPRGTRDGEGDIDDAQ